MPLYSSLGDRGGLGPLKQALHAYSLRHKAISTNIANAEVEGYTPRRVDFEAMMRKASGNTPAVFGEKTNAAHMDVGARTMDRVEATIEDERPGAEGAGVDLEKQMVDLVENQLSYRLAVRLLDMKYTQLHSAIRGTSR